MISSSFPGLERYLESGVAEVEAALERSVARFEGGFGAGVDPATRSAVRHGVLSGGKRLRPVLCIAAYEACGGTRAPGAYDLAAALELIHAFSLMHDDLPCMDDAELRRGRLTTHRVHGEEATILGGAALIPMAALQALEACAGLGCDEARARRVARRLMEASGAGGMVGGQWLDLLGEGRTLTKNELDELHRRKTGALLAASVEIGAIAAGASDDDVEAVIGYGQAIGLAFQIADDVLDATASAETLGKIPSDAELDKSTYVAQYGLADARARAREQVEEALGALDAAGLRSDALEALARYVVERGK